MDPIIGQIILWSGVNFVPYGWLACEGQELPIQQYAALYSLLGTTYGGDGRSTFKLPDLRDRIPMGVNTANANPLGKQQGAIANSAAIQIAGAVTLTTNNLPAHNHTGTFSTAAIPVTAPIAIPVNDTASDSGTPSATQVLGKLTVGTSVTKIYTATAANTTLKPFNASFTVPASTGSLTTGNTGAGQPASVASVIQPNSISTKQPSLSLRFIIAVEGVYPQQP